MRRTESPAHGGPSSFRCEECTVIDVDRSNYTVKVQTQHTTKDPEDIQVGVGYRSPEGDFVGTLPEVGSKCHIAFPTDNTPPFVFAFIGEAEAIGGAPGEIERSTSEVGGSPTNVSFRNRAPTLNPGDHAMVTRDGNHLIVRRGGVLELGATPLAKRIYLPLQNYIKDFCENYALHGLGGDIEWTVARVENDPGGDAPVTYVHLVNEYAQDEKASVRIRHFPPGQTGTKTAYEIDIAAQGIARGGDGAVTSATYHLDITLDGDTTETMASRSVTIEGDDNLDVGSNWAVSVGRDLSVNARGRGQIKTTGALDLEGAIVRLGGADAVQPGVLGLALVQWMASAQWVVAGTVASVSPASLVQLRDILSDKVRLK